MPGVVVDLSIFVNVLLHHHHHHHQGNGRYRGRFTTTVAGDYVLRITVNGYNVPKSPFTVTIESDG